MNTTKKTINVKVDEGALSFLESVMYEVHSRRDLITYALSINQPLDTDSFKEYQKELVKYTREYELARDNLIDTYVKPVIIEKGIDNFSYSVNFLEGHVEVTYTDCDAVTAVRGTDNVNT